MAEVDALLGCVAAEIDAGRPVGPLIRNAMFRARSYGYWPLTYGYAVSGGQAEQVPAHSTDLVMTLLSGMAGDSDAVRSSLQRSLVFRIKDQIDRRLADPALCPAEIAAAANISTGYLHKLFAAEHRSVSEYVRGLRLDRCRRDLLDPRLADLSISTIAFRWGFGDLSGFTRAFKATFGASPRDVRGAPSRIAHR